MLNRLLKVTSLILVVLMLSACTATPAVVNETKPEVKVQLLTEKSEDDSVLHSRFLNMLNHNYVYNNDFYFDNLLINNSIIALLHLRDEENDSYINSVYVSDFIFNLYGKIYNDYSFLNTEFPQIDGYVYIVPRGFTEYEHSIVSVEKNLDNSYTVVTDITYETHDGEVVTEKATTLFIENSESIFGFNILYSDIEEAALNITVC